MRKAATTLFRNNKKIYNIFQWTHRWETDRQDEWNKNKVENEKIKIKNEKQNEYKKTTKFSEWSEKACWKV